MKILAIDLLNTLIRAFSVNSHLSYEGQITGGTFGFIKMTTSAITSFKPDVIVVCKDKKPYLRSESYPLYKANRHFEKNEERDVAWEFNYTKTKEFLELMRVPIWEIKGYEADDLIAKLVQDNDNDQVCIVSNDNDLYQLLVNSNVFLMPKHDKIVTSTVVQEQYGVKPDQWVLFSALMGTHNNVTGIKGVGKKTAAKIVNDPDRLEMAKAIHGDLIQRNVELIRIPFGDDLTPFDLNTAKPKHDRYLLPSFFNTLGIEYTRGMAEALEQFK